MDGVIIDSTHIHTLAWQQYLETHGIKQAYIAERMLGKHNSDIVQEFFSGFELTADDIVRHGAKKEALYRDLMRAVIEDHLVPGVREFLRSHAGVPMAVASNAEQTNVDFVLDAAGLRQFFGAVATGHDVARPKPAPDIYLHCARMLNVKPNDCVVFEDSATGISAGRAAGMRVVGVLTTVPAFDNVELTIRDFRDPRLKKWLESFAICA
jgi:HAD superfamily hydrolase (TIGR01509 family)